MAIDFETLALAKNYTNGSISGIQGALAGKNCTIASITDIPGGHRVTFQWTADDSTTRTQTMDVMDGSGAEAIEQIYADNGVLGAKNLWSKDAEHTFIKSSARVYEGNALNFKQGDKLTVSFDISDVANFGGTQGICVKFIDQNNVDVSSYYDYGIVAGHYKHTFTITSNPTGKIRAYMFLYNTEPNDNATLKISNIMVYLASDTDDTYVPYAMTNRELTEKISVESLTINLTASDKATKLRDDSRRCGNIVNIRIQLQVTAEIASDTEIFRLNGLPHSGYSTAILGETNTGEIIPLMIQTSDSNFVAYCRKTIPTGYYAISYTYVI